MEVAGLRPTALLKSWDFRSLLFGNSIAARLLRGIEPILPNPAAAGATAHGQRQQKDPGNCKQTAEGHGPKYARRTRRFLGSSSSSGCLVQSAHPGLRLPRVAGFRNVLLQPYGELPRRAAALGASGRRVQAHPGSAADLLRCRPSRRQHLLGHKLPRARGSLRRAQWTSWGIGRRILVQS
jgi:hypothetical protein